MVPAPSRGAQEENGYPTVESNKDTIRPEPEKTEWVLKIKKEGETLPGCWDRRLVLGIVNLGGRTGTS